MADHTLITGMWKNGICFFTLISRPTNLLHWTTVTFQNELEKHFILKIKCTKAKKKTNGDGEVN